MTPSFTSIILAGGIRRPQLSAQLGMPVLCLPVSRADTVLSAWLRSLSAAGDCQSVRIVVSDENDARQIRQHLDELSVSQTERADVQVILEPAKWRGTGGTLQDVVADVDEGELLLMVEGSCLPPVSLDLLFEPLASKGICTVGIGDHSEPAGAYAFKREVLSLFPSVGYFDVKEQLLPKLYDHGRGARAVKVTDHVVRLRGRVGYLEAVSRVAGQGQMVGDGCDRDWSRVSSSAMVSATSLIGADVVIEDGAVIHDSVVMTGSVVRSGAIVRRSVVGSNAEIRARRILTETVEPGGSGARRC